MSRGPMVELPTTDDFTTMARALEASDAALTIRRFWAGASEAPASMSAITCGFIKGLPVNFS